MSNYADSNGTKIYYQIRGEGEPLELIMGFGADGNTWEKHVAEYEKHFQCIIIDNRGVGQSDQPLGPYTTQMMAKDTITLKNEEISFLIIGSVVAAITGYISLRILIKIVTIGKLHLFSYYCWPVGLFVILFFL